MWRCPRQPDAAEETAQRPTPKVMETITTTDEVATAADVITSTEVIEKQPDSKYIFEGVTISPEVTAQG